MPSVNPDILRWARETAGFTLEEAADKLTIDDARKVPGADRLAAYESGEREPTRPLLLRMAKQYRRPLLAFYMSQIPRTGQRGQDFRTLPPERSRAQDALVDTMIRDVRARQEMVRAIMEDEDEAVRLPFVGSMEMNDGVDAVLQSIRETLNLDVDRYRGRQAANRTPSGFGYLRQQAERAGIFVLLIGNLGSHHTNIEVEIFRGFALADVVSPFIVINDQDAEPAWSFTLLHELCHIWLGRTGVSGTDASTDIEQFCNDVAGRFFLPAVELAELRDIRVNEIDQASARISDFAESRHVSRSMVAYKLFREGVIDYDQWRGLSNLFRSRWLVSREAQRERNRNRDGGPSYYVVKRHRLGDALVSLTRRVLAERALTPTKAAIVLGVKPSNVYSLVDVGVEPPSLRGA
jgi:Zn-dependent peptidase ImmA (M78 family)/transcriptional regulator with XRE-family HTH domain